MPSSDLDPLICETAKVPPELAGQRLDAVAVQLFDGFSRSRLSAWIKDGCLTVGGTLCRPRDRVKAGALLQLNAQMQVQGSWQGQDIALNILYEDAHILVLDKPAGLVVHPAAGHADGTLLNALLHHLPELSQLPRAGIVHRLDKDTSGLLVVGKTLQAQTALVAQLQARSISRIYQAVISGTPPAGGTVDAPIGRHPIQRQKMAVTAGGKPAVSHWRVLSRFRAHSHIQVKLETGRTHQIRVHMAHIGHPLLGDAQYGARLRLPAGASQILIDTLKTFPRQALHAKELALTHPHTGQRLHFESTLAADFCQLLQRLKDDAKNL
ncbi:RNA pseudouridine synthase [Ventosimonas gracilis]|uniref:Pseudouridine synthase n=1 Tax=Ventosimonas gracilis TaxID=1680762 RepID=A0A139STV0_9GAMM|nr:23S rRNA pseudouridine(1911/1915/1917) synthase RluD [Ventosimonas gracilis]KXU38017.1 RNA pseudouridine synthase [Ventosimonas gracilis]